MNERGLRGRDGRYGYGYPGYYNSTYLYPGYLGYGLGFGLSDFLDSPDGYPDGYGNNNVATPLADNGLQYQDQVQGGQMQQGGAPYSEDAAPVSQYGDYGPQYAPQYGPQVQQAASAPARAPLAEEDAVTIVFKDGRPSEQVRNYALTRSTLYITDKRLREIPLDQVDLAATQKVNHDAGVAFQLPQALGR